MRAAILASAIALTLTACAAPEPPTHALYLPAGRSMEIEFNPGVDLATVAVKQGKLSVLFWGARLRLRAMVAEGRQRATCTDGLVEGVTITAVRPSVFTLRHEP
ncbi:MAG: hypothetical protein HYY16_13395 [Planctomycetes bacterium]|nr:hypothetical protein [Planctomycetota bacterium]